MESIPVRDPQGAARGHVAPIGVTPPTPAGPPRQQHQPRHGTGHSPARRRQPSGGPVGAARARTRRGRSRPRVGIRDHLPGPTEGDAWDPERAAHVVKYYLTLSRVPFTVTKRTRDVAGLLWVSRRSPQRRRRFPKRIQHSRTSGASPASRRVSSQVPHQGRPWPRTSRAGLERCPGSAETRRALAVRSGERSGLYASAKRSTQLPTNSHSPVGTNRSQSGTLNRRRSLESDLAKRLSKT